MYVWLGVIRRFSCVLFFLIFSSLTKELALTEDAMLLYVCYLVLLIFLTRCFCSLIQEVETWSEKVNNKNVKCFKTVIEVTYWESHNFLIISEDMSMIESSLFKQEKIFAWRLQSVKDSKINGFVNVIIFTMNFNSLNEILRTVNMKKINTRVLFVISLKENFSSLDEIEKASKGISKVFWNLDKTRVLFLVPKKKDILAMTYFPFGRNCQPGKLEILSVWREGSFGKEIDLFPEKMLDIRGCVINYSAISLPSMRLQGFKEYTKKGEVRLGGVGGKLIYIIAERMNMKLHLSEEEPESWYTLLSQIKNDTSLFSVFGNIPMAKYLDVLDQDFGYMQEGFGFGYLTGGLDVSWKNFIWPMMNEVWAWIGYTFLFFCPVVFAANLIHRKIGRSNQLRFLDVFGIFIGYSRDLPLSTFGRYLFGIWIFYSYLIIMAYNSALVSFLTTPNEKGVINSLEELIADGMDFGGGDFHREFYNDPSDPVMMKIYNKFKIWSDEECSRMLSSGKGATGVVTSMTFTYHRNKHGDHRLRMLEDKAFTFHVPLSMRRGSPFTIGVHRYAWRAIQSGLVQYWLSYYTNISTSTEIHTKTPIVITLRHLRGILYLYLAGLICSCVVFIGEFIFRKYFSDRCIRRNIIIL